MNKYRVKHVPEIGFFAQVKAGFLCPWQRIGIHTDGFGLYDGGSMSHPMDSISAADERLVAYKDYLKKCSKAPVYYRHEG